MIFKHSDREKENYIMFLFVRACMRACMRACVRACMRVICVFIYSRLPYNAVNTLRGIWIRVIGNHAVLKFFS